MTDTPEAPTPAPVAAAVKPRASVELNLACLLLIGVIVVASLVAVYVGMSATTVAIVAGGPVTALFGIINRGPAQ